MLLSTSCSKVIHRDHYGEQQSRRGSWANLEAAAAYLDVAPGVVLVAHDAPLPDVPLTVPRELADPETPQQFVDAYDLGSPGGPPAEGAPPAATLN